MVLVFLPTFKDFYDDEFDGLRKWLKDAAKKMDVPFVDLVEEIRALSLAQEKGIFGNHYTEEGNRYVAQKIYRVLLDSGAIPAKTANATS